MKIIKLKEEIEYQHTHPNSEFSLIGYWYAKGYSDEEIEKKNRRPNQKIKIHIAKVNIKM